MIPSNQICVNTMALLFSVLILSNTYANKSPHNIAIQIFGASEYSLSKETIDMIGNYNDDLYTSSVLEIIYTGKPRADFDKLKNELTRQLQKDGISTRNLKLKYVIEQSFLVKHKIKPGIIYLYFTENEQKSYSSGMNPLAVCQSDTLIETEQGYGLLYNRCDFDSKERLPTVRIWGKNTFNGSYVETPSKPKDNYVNHAITYFTVLRNDSSTITEGIVIPVDKGIPQRNVILEKYLPRAYKWVATSDIKTGKINRNRLEYLFADIEKSGHYRFVNEPLKSAHTFCVEAPKNTCFQQITLESSPCNSWKGVISDGKTKAVFITPGDPTDFKCMATLVDVNGNIIEIKDFELKNISSKSDVNEKSLNNYKFHVPGYKTVTATTIFRISQSKMNNNRLLYSKL